MASMSSDTPFLVMVVSSSLVISSNVKPYWKPEQPPPCTNTRSFRSGLPSSAISSATLAAALSVKTKGAGISVGTTSATALMGKLREGNRWSARNTSSEQPPMSEYYSKSINHNTRGCYRQTAIKACTLPSACAYIDLMSRVVGSQFERGLFFKLGQGRRTQLTKDDRTLVHFKRLVRHIALDFGLRLKLQQLGGMHRAEHPAIDDDVVGVDMTGDGSRLADHQNAGAAVVGADVADHIAIDAQPVRKLQVALNATAVGNQALDGRLLLFAEHEGLLEERLP